MKQFNKLLLASFFILPLQLFGDELAKDILPMRERAKIRDALLKDRFETVLPEIMRRNNMDMWLIIAREYNEDPVVKTLLPPTWLNARRRTIIVFSKTKKAVDAVAITRYNFGNNIRSIWDKEKQPDQWEALSDYITSKNPKRIGINTSEAYGLADGLVKTDYDGMMKALPKAYHNRVVSAEKLAVRWIETRTDMEMILFSQLVEITHNIIAEAFSLTVIKPGVTTTDDIVWWYRDRIRELNFVTWFHPSVSIQRGDKQSFDFLESFSNAKPDNTVLPGDLLHVDFGITYLSLNTDTQQHSYVLMPGENTVPNELSQALATGNRLQDILTNQFKTGRTGNQMLLSALEQAKSEGINPQIYTHPLGTFGHSAGTTIGMWDSQNGVPFNGDYALHKNTVYAIELNTTVAIKEWNKDIRIKFIVSASYELKNKSNDD